MVGKVHITKFSDAEFHFEYDEKEDAKEIENLSEFEYEGRHYEILDIVETFDISGYHSFMVYTKPQRNVSTIFRFKRKK